ncbi:MAG: hypothetical protein NTV88_06120 [Candidatus Micrarchaeota archaeon]|nr:hypothetical protein [Candidatus Micrarchaeota archaeon]
MTLQCANNSIEVLRSAVKQKITALERKNPNNSLFANVLNGSKNKLALLSTALSKAQTEDDIYEVTRKMTQVEKEMNGQRAQKIEIVHGISAQSGKRIPFFDYLVQEELPEKFVETALDFRHEVKDFGCELAVDSGIVFSKLFGKQDEISGHIVRTYSTQPAVHSEYPNWKRRGESHDFAVSCSIKLYDAQLGFSGKNASAFVYSRIVNADDFSQSAFGQMESKYRISGFSLELNEDGERLHAYFITNNGKLTATLFGKTLTVPPEAWQIN